jgi:hypothetical protein
MTLNIFYWESVLYTCVEITALSDVVSFVDSSQVVALILVVRDLDTRLNVRCVVVFFSRVTFLNRLKVYCYQ